MTRCHACAFEVSSGLLMGISARFHSCGKVDSFADAVRRARVDLEHANTHAKPESPDDWTLHLAIKNALLALGSNEGWPGPPEETR